MGLVTTSAVPSNTRVGSWQQRLRDPAVLTILVLVAAALRWPGLNPSSLWLDDAWVAMVIHADAVDEIRHIGLTAPGFAAALKGIFVVFGFSEPAAQALPFLAGIAAPPFAYFLARRLGWGLGARWTAALLVALSPIAVTYGVRVKPYTVDLLLALLIIWAGVELHTSAQHHGRRRTTVVLLGVAAIPFSPFSAVHTTAALGTDTIVRLSSGRGGRELHRSAAALSAWGTIGVLWYLAALRPLLNEDLRAFWDPGYITLSDGPFTALRSLADRLAHVVGGLMGLATRDPLPTAVAIALLFVSTVVVARHRPWLALLLGLPLAAGIGLAMIGAVPLGTGRGDMYLYPSVALLLAGGMDGLWTATRGWRARLLRGGVVLLLAVVVGAGLSPASYPHQNTRPLVERLTEQRNPTDRVLIYPFARFAFALYGPPATILTDERFGSTAFDIAISDERVLVLPIGRDDPSVYTPSVQEVAASGSRVWLLASHWRDDLAQLKKQLRRAGLRQTDRVRRAGAELTLWEPI